MDSDNDGVGDLAGITSQLDYLRWLGVDAIWISPIFPSPMKDFGYDVSDYQNIDPLFGNLNDFDELLKAAHARNLKVILDFVPNHSSDQHPWFLESKSSKNNPKRDWYIWRDAAADGGPPNNWLSHFGGSGWEYDAHTEQYFYHAFLKEQPDLNWRNPEVVETMLNVLRFWLERGVDGFRVDVIWHLIKDAFFENNPINPDWHEGLPPFQSLIPLKSTDRPEVHDVIAHMRRLFEEYDDRVLIGEIYLPVERLVAYYGVDLTGTHLPFNFQLIYAKWDASHIAQLINEYETALPEGGWPNWVLGNHDQHRIASRIGIEQARVAAMLLLTLRGTPTMYYGDEISMRDVPISPEQVQDPFEKNVPNMGCGRDPERTPLQWNAEKNAGFTQATPWLPVAEDFQEINVEAQKVNTQSMLALYRHLIDLRQNEVALQVGKFELLKAEGDVLAYIRYSNDKKNTFLIVLNLGHQAHVFQSLPKDLENACIVLSTHLDRNKETVKDIIEVRADEGLIIKIEKHKK
ncbi:MAG: alpha-amylase family glycosyl hydrolase [Pseudomonadota bacterium]